MPSNETLEGRQMSRHRVPDHLSLATAVPVGRIQAVCGRVADPRKWLRHGFRAEGQPSKKAFYSISRQPYVVQTVLKKLPVTPNCCLSTASKQGLPDRHQQVFLPSRNIRADHRDRRPGQKHGHQLYPYYHTHHPGHGFP